MTKETKTHLNRLWPAYHWGKQAPFCTKYPEVSVSRLTNRQTYSRHQANQSSRVSLLIRTHLQLYF